ncbi:MAG: competence/damage-inducible protein A [Planctomycetes bacterium]|nr:competence/damage-inducible protein A [Planctomycetota bacterium]
MKKASIVSIGNEILSGETIDTNAAYLSSQLISSGIPVISSYTIGDCSDSIVRRLELAADDADIVLVTGGLGPTDDDLTRQAFAKFLNVELTLQNELLEKIQQIFTSRNRQMSPKNKIQAYLPAGTKAITNNLGTAPGIMAEIKDKLFFALPGVPSEMKEMFERTVLPKLKTLTTEQAVIALKLKCFGAGESTIAEKLGDLMQRNRNPLINCTANYGVVTLHIIAKAKDKKTAKEMVEKDKKSLTKLLGKLIYGSDEQTLAQVVGEKLAQKKMTIAIAESCTGGLLAKLITDIPGASRYFNYGWVTYSNAAKAKELGVPADLIENYGAVSSEVAQAMAEGAKKTANADIAIGITGIAGPTTDNSQKPVGLVYIALASNDKCQVKCFTFSHDRNFIRPITCQTALNMIRLKL